MLMHGQKSKKSRNKWKLETKGLSSEIKIFALWLHIVCKVLRVVLFFKQIKIKSHMALYWIFDRCNSMRLRELIVFVHTGLLEAHRKIHRF